MAAPFRITHRAVKSVADAPQANFNDYLERLVKLIPAEVLSLYLGVKGFIEDEKALLLGWTIFCFIAVVIARVYGTSDPKNNKAPQLLAVLISCVSYLLWVHSSGDIFTLLGIHYPKLGSMLVAGWVFLVPFVYKGDRTTSSSNS